MQCGKHGYSARDYGFRFDIEVDAGDMGAAGTGAGGRTDSKGASEKGAGDGHVYVSKVEKEKIRVNEKEIAKAKEKEKENAMDKEEDKELTDISASLEAIEIETPCDELMRECLFVPIPIPIHPHAGDPLLVEDPGRPGNPYPLFFYLRLIILLSHYLLGELYVCLASFYFILAVSSCLNHH